MTHRLGTSHSVGLLQSAVWVAFPLSAFKLLAGLVTLALGFEGISDDDFSRTVIAQYFALDPRFSPSEVAVDDPSQTSWLPLPFWIAGLVMRTFGSSLAVAQGVGVVLGAVASLLVYLSARRVHDGDGTKALLAAVLASVLPWSLRLGASAVPDLFVAGLLVAAVAYASGPRPLYLLSSAFMLCACLSRYDAWVLALPLGLVIAASLLRKSAPLQQLSALPALALLALGPAAWLVWNHQTYADPLHFLHVVADYKNTLEGANQALRALEYVRALGRAEPELLIGSALLLAAAPRQSRSLLFQQHRLALTCFGSFIALLTLLGLRGGGPTHHPERAIFAVHLYLTLIVAGLAVDLWRAGLVQLTRRTAGYALGCLAISALLRVAVLRRESFAARESEVVIGRTIGSTITEKDRVIVSATDFGHFAVQAAAARPGQVFPDRPVGPLLNASTSASDFYGAAQRVGATHLVGPFTSDPPFPATTLLCHRELCLYRRDP